MSYGWNVCISITHESPGTHGRVWSHFFVWVCLLQATLIYICLILLNTECVPGCLCELFYLRHTGCPSLLLTFTNGSCTTGLREAVSLNNRAAETHIHETLSGSRERSSAWQQDSCPTSQQRANFLEHQPGQISRRQIRSRRVWTSEYLVEEILIKVRPMSSTDLSHRGVPCPLASCSSL